MGQLISQLGKFTSIDGTEKIEAERGTNSGYFDLQDIIDHILGEVPVPEAVVPRRHPGFIVGRKYFPGPYGTTSAATTANNMYAVPLILPEPAKIAELICSVTTAVAGNILMGVYSHDPVTGQPKDKLCEAPAASLNATGDIASVVAAPPTLDAGLYWTIGLASVAATMTLISGTDPNLRWLLGTTNAALTRVETSYVSARNYGDGLPASWTGGAATNGGAMIIGYKVGA